MMNHCKRKKRWAELMYSILLFFVNHPNREISKEELEKEFGEEDVKRVGKILEDNPNLKLNKTKKGVVKSYDIKDSSKLLEDVGKYYNEVKLGKVRRENSRYKIISTMLTLYLLFFTGFQIYSYVKLEGLILNMNSEQLMLESNAVLQIRSWDKKIMNSSNYTWANICISNRGEIESGEILLKFQNLENESFEITLNSINPKSLSCSNIENFPINLENPSIRFSCTSCVN